MSIVALLVALCYIAILCIIGRVAIALIKPPSEVGMLIWAIVAILCVLVLLDVIVGGGSHIMIWR
jgi:hypothetical protein